MVERTICVQNATGLHARPASMLAEIAGRYRSRIWIIKDDRQVECDSVLSIMQLAAVYNSTLIVRAEGEDEEEAANALEQCIADGFDEQ
jgi:phosphotransferase system HPr (HPr) family protein